jgi:RimJ/RimL family protein N-acetyltransferase
MGAVLLVAIDLLQDVRHQLSPTNIWYLFEDGVAQGVWNRRIRSANQPSMITLVPFAPAHFDPLISWFRNEAEAVQWAGATVTFPLDHEQLQAMLDETLDELPQRLAWMAACENRLVGHLQLAFDWRNGIGRLARVGIAPAERGHGFAAAMLGEVVERAFAMPGIERLELNVFSFNTPALRAYERLGFVREGVRRSSARVGSERWDTVMMGLLKAEYRSEPGRKIG